MICAEEEGQLVGEYVLRHLDPGPEGVPCARHPSPHRRDQFPSRAAQGEAGYLQKTV